MFTGPERSRRARGELCPRERSRVADLLEIVAAERGLRRSIVNKNGWVTHALWALSVGVFEVWFHGGAFGSTIAVGPSLRVNS